MGERGDTHRTPRPPAGPTGGRARRRLARAALAAGLVAAAAACTQPGGGGGGGDARGSFDVLTYNVAGLPQEISTENPREHIPLISPLLNDYDVVLTQEDFDWWMPILDQLDFVHYHERLRAEATHEHRSAQHPGPEAVGIDPAARGMFVGDGNGVLSRLPFTGNTRVPWTGCFGGADTADGGAGDCLAMKGFAMVTMTLPSGALVDLYTLHAEAGGTAEDQRLQGEDFAQLADFIAATSAGRAVILGGDTNLHTDGTHPDAEGQADTVIWQEFLAATGLTDACTATACPDTGSIDKIAYRSGDGVRLTATSHTMPRARFTAPDGEALSDHPPVVVEFTWRGRRGD
jgi:endonuclease/exonuclease/phosphatase (EEP) superfamily protein YafD